MVSCALLTSFLHEHAYINSFLSHYKNIGFKDFYIICDINQPSYIPFINEDLKNSLKINFFNMNYDEKDSAKFEELQRYYYKLLVRIIPHEWILLCDADEFLYLQSNNIQSYLQLFQKTNVNQIIFPWMTVNQLTNDTENMFDNLDNNKWYKCDRVKSIFRKRAIVNFNKNRDFSLDTHGVIVNGFTYTQIKFLNSTGFLTHLPNHYNNVDYSKISFMIHFHVRSFKNNIIKILTNNYNGKSDNSQRSILLNNIKNNIYDYSNLGKFSLIKNNNFNIIQHFPLTKLNKNILFNNISYNDDLFNKLMLKYNVDLTYFNTIFNNPEIVISPVSLKYITQVDNKKIDNKEEYIEEVDIKEVDNKE